MSITVTIAWGVFYLVVGWTTAFVFRILNETGKKGPLGILDTGRKERILFIFIWPVIVWTIIFFYVVAAAVWFCRLCWRGVCIAISMAIGPKR